MVGVRLLEPYFTPAITEPGKLHVPAKRYLCATEDAYFDMLSPVSVKSLELQGGPFTGDQTRAFEKTPTTGTPLCCAATTTVPKTRSRSHLVLLTIAGFLRRGSNSGTFFCL